MVDPPVSTTSDSNGVLQPGETDLVMPSWVKAAGSSSIGRVLPLCSTDFTEEGRAATLTGPAAGDYVIAADAAQYGTFGYGTAPSNSLG